MSGEPLVKVILTTCNRREWARLALESVMEQSYQNLQVVVVDDGSTDGTAEMALQFAQRHREQVTVVAKGSNRGLGDSMRIGLEAAADADFVAFMNDDDVWLPDKIAQQVQRMHSDPGIGTTITDAFFIDANGSRSGETLAACRDQPLDLPSIASHGIMAYASSIVVQREIAERLRRTMPLVTTWDWYVMLVAAGMSRIERLDEPLFELRISPGSLSTGKAVRISDEVKTFAWFIEVNQDLLAPLGGVDGARRQLAALAVWRALLAATASDWRSYFSYAWIALGQRQPVAAVSLLSRTALLLLHLRSYS